MRKLDVEQGKELVKKIISDYPYQEHVLEDIEFWFHNYMSHCFSRVYNLALEWKGSTKYGAKPKFSDQKEIRMMHSNFREEFDRDDELDLDSLEAFSTAILNITKKIVLPFIDLGKKIPVITPTRRPDPKPRFLYYAICPECSDTLTFKNKDYSPDKCTTCHSAIKINMKGCIHE